MVPAFGPAFFTSLSYFSCVLRSRSFCLSLFSATPRITRRRCARSKYAGTRALSSCASRMRSSSPSVKYSCLACGAPNTEPAAASTNTRAKLNRRDIWTPEKGFEKFFTNPCGLVACFLDRIPFLKGQGITDILQPVHVPAQRDFQIAKSTRFLVCVTAGLHHGLMG